MATPSTVRLSGVWLDRGELDKILQRAAASERRRGADGPAEDDFGHDDRRGRWDNDAPIRGGKPLKR